MPQFQQLPLWAKELPGVVVPPAARFSEQPQPLQLQQWAQEASVVPVAEDFQQQLAHLAPEVPKVDEMLDHQFLADMFNDAPLPVSSPEHIEFGAQVHCDIDSETVQQLQDVLLDSTGDWSISDHAATAQKVKAVLFDRYPSVQTANV
jgi:hypothetical protein